MSAEEDETWRSLLRMNELLCGYLDRQLQQDSQLSITYFGILAALSEAPASGIRMSKLAAVVHSSQSRLSHAVSRLEKRGWVSRTQHETDKRGSVAHITDEGRAVVMAAAPGHIKAVRAALFAQLTPDEQQLLNKICQRVSQGLEGSLVNRES